MKSPINTFATLPFVTFRRSMIFRLSHVALLFMFFLGLVKAQAPDQFSFQGVARNAEGKMIASKSIALKITIRYATIQG